VVWLILGGTRKQERFVDSKFVGEDVGGRCESSCFGGL